MALTQARTLKELPCTNPELSPSINPLWTALKKVSRNTNPLKHKEQNTKVVNLNLNFNKTQNVAIKMIVKGARHVPLIKTAKTPIITNHLLFSKSPQKIPEIAIATVAIGFPKTPFSLGKISPGRSPDGLPKKSTPNKTELTLKARSTENNNRIGFKNAFSLFLSNIMKSKSKNNRSVDNTCKTKKNDFGLKRRCMLKTSNTFNIKRKANNW